MAFKMSGIVVKEFGDPKVLTYQKELPIPTAEEGEVVIKVNAVAVNSIDCAIRAGKHPNLPELPYIPGNDVSGYIDSVGEGVTRFQVGDKVASFMHTRTGGYAQYVAVHEDWVLLLPRDYDLHKAAAMGTPFCTAYRALYHKAKAKPGDTVLVHGAAGGVGLACSQLASANGMLVIGTAGSPVGQQAVLQSGAKAVVNHRTPGYVSKISEASKGGPNIIIEMLSNVNLNRDLTMLAPRGTVVVIASKGTVEINPRLLMAKECSIYGCCMTHSNKKELMEVKAAIESAAKLDTIQPQVGASYPLESASLAHTDIRNVLEGAGKTVLKVHS